MKKLIFFIYFSSTFSITAMEQMCEKKEEEKKVFLEKIKQNLHKRDQLYKLLEQAHKQVGPLGNLIDYISNSDGLTDYPLHFAVKSYDLDLLNLLFQHNISPDQLNSSNETAHEVLLWIFPSENNVQKHNAVKTNLYNYSKEWLEKNPEKRRSKYSSSEIVLMRMMLEQQGQLADHIVKKYDLYPSDLWYSH